MKRYEIKAYATQNGRVPFEEWLMSLKSRALQSKIYSRLRRLEYGHFGDANTIKGAKGLYELREHSGAGYRIFDAIVERQVILLLAGSAKKDQDQTIRKVKEYLAQYQERKQP